MESTYRYVHCERDDAGIAWITLNRPEKRNAMSPPLHAEMTALLRQVRQDPQVGVVVVTGAGEAFSAGQDLKEYFRDLDDKPGARMTASEDARWRWEGLWLFPKPTIAMVNGYCFGGAFPIVIACDLAIAAEEAVFGLSEINWAQLPGGMVSRVLAEALRYRDAMYYAMTGDSFDGREAARIGLVNKAVPAAELRTATTELAHKLLSKNRMALQYTKEAYKTCKDMNYQQAEDYLRTKTMALKLVDSERGRDAALRQFLDDKTYRPGFEEYARGAKEK